MTPAEPIFLLLGFLAVPVILLHMLRAKRRKVVVSSTLLWKLLPKDADSSRRIRRLIPSLLLILQLLALAGLVTAVTKPYAGLTGRTMGRCIVIIDASASMASTDVKPNRVAKAVELLKTRMKDGKSYTVIRAAAEPEMLAKSVPRSEALGILGGVKAFCGPSDIRGSLSLAASILGDTGSENDEILLATDAKTGGEGLPGVKIVRVPSPGGNISVSSFETRVIPGKSGEYQWVAVVRNFSGSAARVRAELDIDGSKVYSTDLSIKPRGSAVLPRRGASQPIKAREDGLAKKAVVRITPLDAKTQNSLAADDSARLVIHPYRPLNVVVVRNRQTGESPVLKALSLMPSVRISIRNGLFLSAEDRKADLTIYEGISPVVKPAGSAVFLGVLPAFLASAPEPPKPQEFIDWDKTHPLLRFVDLSGVAGQTTIPHPPLPGAKVLAEGQAGPLIEEITQKKTRILVFSFDIKSANLSQRAALPILVANIATWASEPLEPEQRAYMLTTDIVDFGDDASANSLIKPDGRDALRRQKGKAVSVVRLEDPGFYSYLKNGTDFPIAVNYEDDGESDTGGQMLRRQSDYVVAAGRQAPSRTTPDKGGDKGAVIKGRSVWRPFALAACLLLTVEWLLYSGTRLGRFRTGPSGFKLPLIGRRPVR